MPEPITISGALIDEYEEGAYFNPIQVLLVVNIASSGRIIYYTTTQQSMDNRTCFPTIIYGGYPLSLSHLIWAKVFVSLYKYGLSSLSTQCYINLKTENTKIKNKNALVSRCTASFGICAITH